MTADLIPPDDVIEAAKLAIEDVLIEWRDSRLSILRWANGLVIREADGTPSSVVRMTTHEAVRLAAPAIARWGYVQGLQAARDALEEEGWFSSSIDALLAETKEQEQ